MNLEMVAAAPVATAREMSKPHTEEKPIATDWYRPTAIPARQSVIVATYA